MIRGMGGEAATDSSQGGREVNTEERKVMGGKDSQGAGKGI